LFVCVVYECRPFRKIFSLLCFFFQAEDGIRDGHVTGVQTCALPIYTLEEAALHRLVLRARESPGRVSVFEGADQAVAESNHSGSASEGSDWTPSLGSEKALASTFQIPPPLMNEPTIAESQLAPPIAASSE